MRKNAITWPALTTSRMPGWLAFLAQWNPVSATAAACRELFGNPTGATGGVLADHAVLVAAVWPLVLAVLLVPLSARAFRRLSG